MKSGKENVQSKFRGLKSNPFQAESVSRLIDLHSKHQVPPPRNRQSLLLRQYEEVFIRRIESNVYNRVLRSYLHRGIRQQITKGIERILILKTFPELLRKSMHKFNVLQYETNLYENAWGNIRQSIDVRKSHAKLKLAHKVYQFSIFVPRVRDFSKLKVVDKRTIFIRQTRNALLQSLMQWLPQPEILKIDFQNYVFQSNSKGKEVELVWPYTGPDEFLEGIPYSVNIQPREPTEEELIRKELLLLVKFSKYDSDIFGDGVTPIEVSQTVENYVVSNTPHFNQSLFTLRKPIPPESLPKKQSTNYKPALKRPSVLRSLDGLRRKSKSIDYLSKTRSKMITLTNEKFAFKLPRLDLPSYRKRFHTEETRSERIRRSDMDSCDRTQPTKFGR